MTRGRKEETHLHLHSQGRTVQGKHTFSPTMQHSSSKCFRCLPRPPSRPGRGVGPTPPGPSGVSTGGTGLHTLCPRPGCAVDTTAPSRPTDGSIVASLSPRGRSQGPGGRSFLTLPSPCSPPPRRSPHPITVPSCLRPCSEPHSPTLLLPGFSTPSALWLPTEDGHCQPSFPTTPCAALWPACLGGTPPTPHGFAPSTCSSPPRRQSRPQAPGGLLNRRSARHVTPHQPPLLCVTARCPAHGQLEDLTCAPGSWEACAQPAHHPATRRARRTAL